MRRWPLLVIAGAVLSCSTSDPPSVTTSGATTQFTTTFGMGDPDVVFLLEVDDSPDAAPLRTTVASTLRATVERIGDVGNWYDSQRRDPAAWHPVAIRVVLVFPSATGSSHTFGPNDDPRLALVASDSSIAQVDAVAVAVVGDLEAHTATVDAPYRPIEAAMQTLELFAGARAAVDDHEAALLDVLGASRRQVAISVVSQRDDEGSDATAAGAELEALESSTFEVGGGVFTGDDLQANVQCDVPTDTTTRLGEWVGAASLTLQSISLSCVTSQGAALLATSPGGTLGEDCPPEPLAPCALTWSTPTLSACSSDMGLDDPLDPDGVRRPRTSVVDGAEQRVCEIHALDGDDLVACETSITCDGCAPGWCRTHLAIEPSLCPDGGYSLRFIGAAAMRGEGQETITCDLSP